VWATTGWLVSDMSEPCSRSAAIILSLNGRSSRELVEALVDTLITLLDAEDAVSYDMEPDADLEESDEGETETSSEWHLQASVQRPDGAMTPDWPSELSRDTMNACHVQRPLQHGNVRFPVGQAKCRTAVREFPRRCDTQL